MCLLVTFYLSMYHPASYSAVMVGAMPAGRTEMVYFHNERLANRIVAVHRELPVVDGRLRLTADGRLATSDVERRRGGAATAAA